MTACVNVYISVFDITGSAARTAAINNTYGCDADELCLSFIIKMLQADGKSGHRAVCPRDFPFARR